MLDQKNGAGPLSHIIAAARRRVTRALSRTAGMESTARGSLQLGELEQRVLYSATPVPVPAESETCVVCETSQTHADAKADSLQLVVVDASTGDYQSLLDGLSRSDEGNFEVVLLDPDEDGIERITEVLATRTGVTALHVVSHGTEGQVKLGSAVLHSQSLAAYSGMFSQWDHSLTDDADILFYGCDLAGSSEGLQLINGLSILSGADVAASDDVTGHTDLGGDWELEVGVGEIETSIAFDNVAQTAWWGTLAAPPSLTIESGATASAGSSVWLAETANFDLTTEVGTVEATFTVDRGTLTLADTTGVSLVAGDFLVGQHMTISGSEAAVNQAMSNLVYTAESSFGGTVSFVASIDDLQGGVTAERMSIAVTRPFTANQTHVIANGVDDEMNRGERRGVTRSVSVLPDGTSVMAVTNITTGLSSFTVLNPDGTTRATGGIGTNNARHVSVAADVSDPGGSFVAVWTEGSGADDVIKIQRFSLDGTPSPAVARSPIAGLVERNPSIAMNRAGDYAVVWESGGGNVRFQRFDSADQPIDTLAHLIPYSNGGENPAIGIDADQNVVVSWDDAMAQYYTRFDGTFSSGSLSTASGAGGSAVAMNDAGQAVITWHEQGWDVYAQKIDRDGRLDGGVFQVPETTAGDQLNPSVAIDEAGNFSVAWEGENAISMRRFAWDGTSGPDSRVDSDGAFNDNASIAMLDHHNFVVLYSEHAGDADVLARRFSLAPSVNALPDVVLASNRVVTDGGLTINLDAVLTDTDHVVSSLSLSFTSTRPDIVDANAIGNTGSDGTRSITIPVSSGFRGTAIIDVTVTDPTGGSRTQSIELVVPTEIAVTTAADELDGDVSSLAALYANPGGSGISLREAITAANNTANGGVVDRIVFDIPSSQSHVINVASSLPHLTETVEIDGATSSKPVVLDGNGLPSAGLTIGGDADSSVISGLIVRDFGFSGIHIAAGSDNSLLVGNKLGSFNNRGHAIAGQGNDEGGVFIEGSGNIIGGLGPSEHNVLSGNGIYGVQIEGPVFGNLIHGNLIGTDDTGAMAHAQPALDGVRVIGSAAGTTISQNTILGHAGHGISLFNTASNTVIEQNTISQNDSGGIWLLDQVTNTQIGGSASESNTITYNGGAGVKVAAATTANSIRANVIFGNAGLGIDLSGDGVVQSNDPLDTDVGANNSQNFPTLISATISSTNLIVVGDVQSTPNTIMMIDVYASETADPTGYGEAHTYLGAVAVTTNASGSASFNHTFTGVTVTGGAAVTSTLTDPAGNTSEFSQNVIAKYSTANVAPVNVSPGLVRVETGGSTTFAEATGNRVRVLDVDAGVGQIQVELHVERGSLTLGATNNIGFLVGDGLADAHMVITGTLANVNSALEGLTYEAEVGFGGRVALTMVTNDLASSGSGGALVTTSITSIYVGRELSNVERSVLNDSTTGDQSTSGGASSVAILPDGSYVVVWTDDTADGDGTDGVYARIFNPDGSVRVDEFAIAATISGDQTEASVVADGFGRFAVAWSDDHSGGRSVFFRRFNADGTPVDAGEQLVTAASGNQTNPHLAVNESGSGVIVWQGPDSSSVHAIYAREFGMGTGLAPSDFRVNVVTNGDEEAPRVAINNSGDFVIAYETSGDTWIRRFPDGARTEAAFEVSAGFEPAVAISESGDILLAYVVDRPIADSLSVVAIASDGTVGTAVEVDPVGSTANPHLSTDGYGAYLLSYDEFWLVGTAARFHRVEAVGSTVSWVAGPTELEQTGTATNVSSAMSDSGNAVVVWTKVGSDGDGEAVLGTAFGTADPTAVFVSTAGSGTAGALDFESSEILGLVGESQTLESPTTGGDFVSLSNLASLMSSPTNVNAFHRLNRELVIGPDTSWGRLQKGDLLVSFEFDSTFDSSGVGVQPNDIVLVRPVVGGSEIAIAFDGISDPSLPGMSIQAFTLVEKDTWVGETLVAAGSLLFTPDTAGAQNNIYIWHTEGVGSGTAGYAQLLINGDDVGITQPITAIELAEDSIDIGGQVIGRGALALSTSGYQASLAVAGEDVFVLTPTATTLGSGTAVGTSFLLFDGDDVGLGGPEASLDALSIIGANRNHAPVVTPTNRSLGSVEANVTSSEWTVAAIVGPVGTDPDNDNIGLAITDWSGSGTLEFQRDGDSTWLDVGSVSDTNALLLRPSDLLRYVPDGSTVETASMSFRAWDQTAGDAFADTTVSGGETAFSTDMDSVTLSVTGVVFAPSLSLTPVMPAIDENTVVTSINVADISISHDGLRTPILSLRGPDAADFMLVNTALGAELHFIGASPDFESQERYEVTIEVGDTSYPAADAIDFNLTVNDINEAPALSVNQFTTELPEQAPTSSPLAIADIVILDDGTGTNDVNLVGADAALFQVVGSSLVLRQNVDIAFEVRQSFDFSIEIDDPTIGVDAEAIFPIRIDITDVNDTQPVVTPSQSFLIDEDRSAGRIGDILATDTDTVGSLSDWRIENGTDAGLFSIDPSTGELTLDSASLDYETQASYTLDISVSDGVRRSVIETVVIEINDLNDTAPVVAGSQVFSISEDGANLDSVGFVMATDVDTPTGSLWNWTIEGGNTDGIFQIASGSGEISIADNSNLDFERQTNYVLQVSVYDGAQWSAHTDVLINITDVNDEIPVVASGQSFAVAEDVGAGHAVGTVIASDNDTPAAGLSGWVIESGDAGIFAIDSATGEIVVADPSDLDYETTNSYTLEISVFDGVNRSPSSTVTILIDDRPEAAPVVQTATFSVTENEAIGFFIGSVTATDSDSAPPFVDWQIANDFGLFAIDSDGNLSLIGSPDYEAGQSYSLAITVSDGSNRSVPGTVVVEIANVNDNAPVFDTQPPFSIAENSTGGSVVGTVSASDLDGDTIGDFSIVGGNTEDVFAIDPASGQITVAKPEWLDYERQSVYTLSISVSDGAMTTTESFDVQVTDVAAEMSVSGEVWEDLQEDGIVGENTAIVGATVLLYMDDGDGVANAADVLLSSATTTSSGYRFDGLAQALYYVVVDSRSIVSTTDPSPLSDVWAEQIWGSAGSLRRNGVLGKDGFLPGGRRAAQSDDVSSLVTSEHVTLVDLTSSSRSAVDFGFSFNLVTNNLGGNSADHDPASDRSVQGSLRQFIQNANAIDGGNHMRFMPTSRPSEEFDGNQWWRITVNEALPKITGEHTTIDGTLHNPAGISHLNQLGGISFGQSLVVGPGADLEIGTADDVTTSLMSAPRIEIFHNRAAGSVIVGLDVIGDSSVISDVAITGFGTVSDASSANIRVQADDVHIANALVGASPGSTARPADSSLTAGHNILAVGAQSGSIVDSIITFASRSGVRLTDSSDGWQIQGNQILSNAIFGPGQDGIGVQNGSGDAYIFGNLIVGSGGTGIDLFRGSGDNTISNNRIVGSGQLSEESAGIRIWGSDNSVLSNAFIGNRPADGSVSATIVVSGQYLGEPASTGNRISRNYFEDLGGLSIDLVSGGQSASENKQGDGRTDTPGYNDQTGNRGLDAPVLTIATRDAGETVVIGKTQPLSLVEVYSASADGVGLMFVGHAIANESGEFTLRLPSEVKPDLLAALAIDEDGNTSEFGEVMTVNHPPKITSSDSFSIHENESFVGKIEVSDADLPDDRTGFAIIGGPDASLFKVSAGGVLAFRESPDYENPDDADSDNVYRVVIKASDSRGSFSSQLVSVTVKPVNEHAPVFTTANSVSLPESRTHVLQVVAEDADGPTGDITYSIVGGADREFFQIDASTGILTLSSSLDFDNPVNAENEYFVEVSAEDSMGLSRSQVIRVSILDVNDVAPQVDDQSFDLREDSIDGSVVGVVEASDRDTVGGPLTFRLMNDFGGMFAVDAESGVIRATDTTNLNYEGLQRYDLEVEISDGIQTAVGTVEVSVTDVNESPTDISLNLASVRENRAGATIGTVGVIDEDRDGTHTWSVDDDRFEVTDGVLKLRSGVSLDYEETEFGVIGLSLTVFDGEFVLQTPVEVIVLDEYVKVVGGAEDADVIEEDSGPYVWDLGSVFETNTGSLEFEIVGGSTAGRVTIVGDQLTYSPELNSFGTVTIAVRGVSGSESAKANLSLDVTPVNDAPIASRRRIVAAPGGVVQFDPLGSVTDVDGDNLEVVEGSLSNAILSSDGSIIYRPEGVSSANTEFSYLVRDEGGLSTEVVVDVTVPVGQVLGTPADPGIVDSVEVNNLSGSERTQQSNLTQAGSVADGVEADSAVVEDPGSVGDSSDGLAVTGAGRIVDEADGRAGESETRGIFDPLLRIREAESEREKLVATLIPLRAANVEATEADRRNTRADSNGFGTLDGFSSYESYQQVVGRFSGGPGSEILSQRITTNLEDALDHVEEELADEMRQDQIKLYTASSVFGSLSFGYVLWLLRGGSLVASMLTSIPAWRMVDPLPVLDFLEGGEDDQESLDSLIDRNQELLRESPSQAPRG